MKIRKQILLIFLLIGSSLIYAHKQNVHQYIVREAYQILKAAMGEIPNMEQHIGTNQIGELPWKTGYVVTGAWREDTEDPVYGYSDSWPPGVSCTHFWPADDLQNLDVQLRWLISGEVTTETVPTAYKKMLAYINGGWNLKYLYTPAAGAPVSLCGLPWSYPVLGMSFKYENLIEFFKTGRVIITGYLVTLEEGWHYCDDGIVTYWGQEFRERISWEILGRMCHLLQDMSVPAHAHGDVHGLCDGFPVGGVGHDTYENWVGSDEYPYNSPYTYWNRYNCGDLIDPYGASNPIHYLMYTTQQIADHFGSNGIYNGDGNNYSPYTESKYSWLTTYLQSLPAPTSQNEFSCCSDEIAQHQCLNRTGTSLQNRLNIRDITFPYAIRATAGLLYWFACETGLISRITIQNNFTDGILRVNNKDENSPFVVECKLNDVINIEAIPQTDYLGYERVWNNFSPNNPSKWQKMKNQTFYDLIGGENIYYTINVSLEDDASFYIAGLRKHYKIDVDHKTEFDGIISTVPTTYIVEQNSGIISAPSQQTISNTTYSFTSWDDGNSDNPRIIVPQTNETYTALYKYPHHSNKNEAFSNNNQRKVVQQSAVNQNTMHMVYESMGLVWYERSTDNGNTWQIANNGRPLSYLPSKSPSIDYFNNDGNGDDLIIIAFQHQQAENNENSVIVVQFFKNGVKQFEGNAAISNCSFCEYDMTPVIAYGHGSGRILVVYKEITGLFCKYGLLKPSDSEIQWYSINPFIQSTTAESRNPSLVSYKNIYNNEIPFHLVWQEGETQIKYKKIVSPSSGYNTISQNSTQLLSGSGYTYNRYPSTTVMDDNIVRITWQGERTILSEETKDDDLGKSPAQTLQKRVLFTDPTANRFWGFGSNVGKPTINRSTDNLKYYMAWSEPYLGALNGKSVSNNLNGDSIKTLYGLTGTDIQVVNGATDSEIRAVSLNNSGGLPYYFQISNVVPSQMEKEELVLSGIGREGVVYNGSAQFYFMIGDVIVNGSEVNFVDVPASTVFSSDSVLNRYMQTETFTLNNSSEFLYSVQYGITDSAAVADYLQDGKSISFAVELIDAATGALLGKFDEVTFNSQNIYQYDNLSYEVNTEGIGNREVYLRLATNNNGNVSRSLTIVGADASLIAKRHTKKVGFNGIAAVTDYALSQNYPNPFNPVTMINYQIPKDGFVSLKVYDILGKEIATLVNSDKAQGKYTVEFDGSRFASGMYIYKLQSGDFVETRKMMLLK